MNEKRVTWPGWETVRTIGQGSFGTVYEIQRQVFDDTEKAALKVISIPQSHGDIEEMYTDGYDEESITSTFQSHLKSIVAEYSMTKKMSGCVNIVSCDDVRYVQHDDGIGWDIFIKMELLTPLIKALPVQCDDEEVIRVGMDLCNALQTCRQYDLLHRDIKPQNIFVSDHGDYKLGDFGIAKTVEKTSGGTKIGTYKYMAPEVYNNQPYGAAADQYSLGLVLYWLLNERRMPFLPLPPEKLKSELDEQARKRRMSGEALPAPAHGCPELKKIVLKACAFEPGNRFASAQEMREALQALKQQIDKAKAPTCPSCGGVLKPGAAFCTKCGASLAEKKEPAPENTCPSCGGALKPGAAFCTKCGASLAEKKEPAPENTCPSCGAALKPDTTFCTKCGAILAARVRKPEGDLCSSCGAVLKPGAAFCTKCGARR